MPEQTSDTRSHTEKESRSVQRGRTSPSHTLAEAIGGVESVFKALGTTRHSRDDAASAMGYKPGSGAANSRVGSLTHFGLLDRHGADYQVSELARRILEYTSEDERREAIAEAATAPSLYSELISELDGQPFPPMLSNILSRSYGVVPKSASSVASRFEETLQFAGLLRDNRVHATLRADANKAASETSEASMDDALPQKHRNDAQHSRSPSGCEYRVPLLGGRSAVIEIPRPVADSDIDRVKAWLDLMAPVLTEHPAEDSEGSIKNPET